MNFATLDEQVPKRLVSRLGKTVSDEEAHYHSYQPVSSTSIPSSQPNKSSRNSPDDDDTSTIDGIGSGQTRSNDSSIPLDSPAKSTRFNKIKDVLIKYSKFIGPGIMVSVSYMDPGNYSTAVAAGSAHQYKLLFSVLLSNILAAFLQILCAKLGAVTGMDLAQNCREHLPRRLNLCVYVLAEVAIIATDLAEVIGTAISLNILFGLPLIIGVILTIIDVLIVLMAYKPNGDMKIIRIFEGFVSILVMMTVICFAVELFTVEFTFSEVMKGFLPSREIVEGDGLYLSLAILGATVMPHSLYLGSGLVQSRLKDYDVKNGNYKPVDMEDGYTDYKPSLSAIDDTMAYTITELIVSLFTVALFVNSAILIVAGSTLNGEKDTDLFSIYNLLSNHLSKTAGLIFVLALLFSGQSAGIVCTLAGQMVSEGFLHWSLPPTIRRLITRCVAITPCLVLVLVAGRSGLSGALNASQVVLSLLLPFVSAPLIYFTSSSKIMRVSLNSTPHQESIGLMNLGQSDADLDANLDDDFEFENDVEEEFKDMSNSKLTNIVAVAIWLFITMLNFFLLFSFAIGKDVSF
ncbi:CYFA0S19e01156g1_1 [Cyberlindnera fabianii]|uniref:CYFA0S19e01156g1_1 n=1 Tax=Cyberlindnera fabianii TaxID=36022 RepID=A0A061BF80_CYBFA|nr:CYFA0S19e01156g1_1 [Cyberlindnera fabianii]